MIFIWNIIAVLSGNSTECKHALRSVGWEGLKRPYSEHTVLFRPTRTPKGVFVFGRQRRRERNALRLPEPSAFLFLLPLDFAESAALLQLIHKGG